MSKARASAGDKNLLIILITLCVVAVVLVVVVIINSIPKSQEDIALEQEIAELYWDGMDEEDYEEAQYMEAFYRMHAQVKKLLEKDPIDIGKINSLYDDVIDKILSSNIKDNTNDAIFCIASRSEDFLSKGLKREALDSLLSVDYSVYTDPDRYRLYTDIIDLAKEVGDNNVVEEYSALRATVEDAYWEDYEIVKNEMESYYYTTETVIEEEE